MQDSGIAAFLLACLIGLAGCSPPADGYSGPRGAVAGRIVVDGQAMPVGCQIVFIAARANFVASGIVEQEGRYKLLYQVPQGLPVGDYVVQFGLPSDFASSIAGQPGGPQAMDVAEITRAWKAAMPFPERYLSVSTSGLTFPVEPGPNTADFEITKANQTSKAGK